MIEPRATYRIQLQPDFDLHAARDLVEHLDRLGVSHAYSSPLARATPGSTHGYDVVDPTQVDPALGGAAALDALAGALHAHGMGLLVDVVPNHLAAHETNARWWDLLAEGRDGPGAVTFDVEWDTPDAPGRVVLPLLGEPLEDAIAAGDVRLETRGGDPVVTAPGLILPVASGSDDAAGDRGDVAAVLDAQHYRLEGWRTGERIVNYRRFFDVSTLPAVRVEIPEVFAAQTALAADLLARGVADGIRIDHVDGLRDPAGFLRRCRAIGARWLLVEKILTTDEDLPVAWDVDGTTGYEAADRFGAVLVDPRGEAPLTDLWVEVTGDPRPFRAHEEAGRRIVLERLLVADHARLTRAFARALGAVPGLHEALGSLLAEFGVYRTYVRAGTVADGRDRAEIDAAAARATDAGARAETVATVRRVLLGELEGHAAEDARLRFQQLCAAVTAKGVEDTAGYRYLRLAMRNEVGGDPGRFAWSVEALHQANARASRRPRSLSSLSTHDSKRSADVRARLAVLSEIPDRWRSFVLAQRGRLVPAWAPVEPDPAMELLLLQTAVGAWPIDRARLTDYLAKAAREAKARTSWREPDEAYHDALVRVVETLLTGPARADLELLGSAVLVPGRVNALSQIVLQCTSPGVPDVYWGDEVWNLTLVDPDNRRPPSPRRIDLLVELRTAGRAPSAVTLADPDDPGRPKLWTLHRCLELRRRRPGWFGPDAGYTPIPVTGPAPEHAIAWSRSDGVVAVVPRLTASRPDGWDAAAVTLPRGRWKDVFTGAEHGAGAVDVGTLWADFPVSVLERISDA